MNWRSKSRRARLGPAKSPRSLGGWASLWPFCTAALFALSCGPRAQGTEGGESPTASEAAQEARLEIDVFALGRQLGAIAPCGCTTEPLGGLQYAFGYIEGASADGARLVLEPGSFLFPDPDGPEGPQDEAAWGQAERRASLLSERFNTLGKSLVSGFGPTDIASPQGISALGKFSMPRTLANLSPQGREQTKGVVAHRLVPLDEGMHAGVTAVINPAEAARSADFPATTDPIAAAKAETKAMREAGADLTVVMVQGPRSLAQEVAEQAGADLVVMGGPLEGADRSRLGSAVQRIGATYLLEPGDQIQTIAHLTLSLARTPAPTELPRAEEWTIIPPRASRVEELARVEERLQKFASDPDADPAFIKRLEKERDELNKGLESQQLPDSPAVAMFEQVKITCHLAGDGATEAQLAAYDGWVATENKKRFSGVKAPPVAKGQAAYVGVEECEMCHDEAAAYWETTVHARAYDTLVAANKQFDLNCVGCHVTGFRKPGGSEVVENQGLTRVQCEQCHGPGSIHVDDPEKTKLPAKAAVTICAECHTPEHSDTFEYEAYLRDVLGEGHGRAARDELGEGATGKQLREAGLAKAGGACKKMGPGGREN